MIKIGALHCKKFTDKTKKELDPKKNDIVVGNEKLIYCKMRKGWPLAGGKIETDYDKAKAYAQKLAKNSEAYNGTRMATTHRV